MTDRREAAKRAAATRRARGTHVVARLWWGPALPAWVARPKRDGSQWVRSRNGIVIDAQHRPLVLVSTCTLRIVEWLTFDAFAEIVNKSGGAQLGFSDWVIAPEDCVETGVIPEWTT